VRRRNASLRAAIGMVLVGKDDAAPPSPPTQPEQPRPSPPAATTPKPHLLDILCFSTTNRDVATGAEDLADALVARGHRVSVLSPSSSRGGRDCDGSNGLVSWHAVQEDDAQALLAEARPSQAVLALDWRAASLLADAAASDSGPVLLTLLDEAGGADAAATTAALASASAILAPSPSHAAELLASPAYQQHRAHPPPAVRGLLGAFPLLPAALARAWDPRRDPLLLPEDGYDPRHEQGLGWQGKAAWQRRLRQEVGMELPPGELEAAVAAAEGRPTDEEDEEEKQGDDADDTFDPFALPKELLLAAEEAERSLQEDDDDLEDLGDTADSSALLPASAPSARVPALLAVPCRLSARDGQGGLAAEVLLEALPRLVARARAQVVVVVLFQGCGGGGDSGDDEPLVLPTAWASAQVAATQGLPPPPQSPGPPPGSAARRLLDLEAEFRGGRGASSSSPVRVLFAAEGGRTAARLLHLAFAGADAVVVLPPSPPCTAADSTPQSPPLRPEFALPPPTAAARSPGLFARLAMRYGALPVVYGGRLGEGGGVEDYGAFAEDSECGDGFVYGDDDDDDDDDDGGEEGEEEVGLDEDRQRNSGRSISPLSSYASSSSSDEDEEEGEDEEDGRAAANAVARDLAQRAELACRLLRRRPRRWRAMQLRAAERALAEEDGAWARCAAACEALLLQQQK
jgi:hypothetical protein